MLSIQDVRQALIECLKAEPPVDYCLSRDAAALGGLYGLLCHEASQGRRSERNRAELTAAQVAAFDRWSALASTAEAAAL